MKERTFMTADEVAEELCVSKAHAYKIMQGLNAELKNLGYITISGRINRRYFMEKVNYGEKERRES